jgi:hypothetical protein
MIATVHPPSFEPRTDLLAEARASAARPTFLKIPLRRYFAVDGRSYPGDAAFQAAITALYPAAYALHFALKARGVSAPIGHLEGLYWFDEPMRWRLMIAIPAQATDAEAQAAAEESRDRASTPGAAIPTIRRWAEGPSAQLLHIGPYDAEEATVDRLLDAIATAGQRPTGPHHEIYLSDPRRTPAARLRTVIRHSVSPDGRRRH